MELKVEIDDRSGFCFGVVKAIDKAEELLETNKTIYSIGEIVHNEEEIRRLEKKGLKTINYEQLKQLKNETVLFRAHGEPPSTYKTSEENNNTIVDASCPIIHKLQHKIKEAAKLIDLSILDHIIVCESNYYSFADEGIL